MSDKMIQLLERNLNESRKLISVMQSKISKQREVISTREQRIAVLQVDKKSMAKQLDAYREKNLNDYTPEKNDGDI